MTKIGEIYNTDDECTFDEWLTVHEHDDYICVYREYVSRYSGRTIDPECGITIPKNKLEEFIKILSQVKQG